MNLEVQKEFEEFRPHLKTLEPLNDRCTEVRLTTKEDIVIEVQWTTSGLAIQSSTAPLNRSMYDDLGQVLHEVSPMYRNSFMASLFSKLQQVEDDT